MIVSFACSETRKIYHGKYVKKFPVEIQQRAFKKLRMIHVAKILDDLKNPPGNRLESLKGDRQGQMSIRINNKWRIWFEWIENEAKNIHIVDYH